MPVPSPEARYLLIEGGDDRGARCSGFGRWIRGGPASGRNRRRNSRRVLVGGWPMDRFFRRRQTEEGAAWRRPPQTIASLPTFRRQGWGAKGDILIRPGNREPLYRISESEGSQVQVTSLTRPEGEFAPVSKLSAGRPPVPVYRALRRPAKQQPLPRIARNGQDEAPHAHRFSAQYPAWQKRPRRAPGVLPGRSVGIAGFRPGPRRGHR